MSKSLNATMTIANWEEGPLELPEYLTAGAPKLVRMKFERTYKGDIEGKGVAFYTSNYRNDGDGDPHKSTARFAGLTYFNGEIKGVGKGTVVFIDEGTWDPAAGAVCDFVSDANSGTDALAGLKAKGHYVGTVGCQEDPVTLEIQN